MHVKIIGTGEASDSGLGNNSFLLYVNKISILIDCGYQIPERLWAKNLHKSISIIYFTHTHADHSFGIVPLLARYAIEGRKREIVIIGNQGIEAFIKSLLDLGYPNLRKKLPFPIKFLIVKDHAQLHLKGLYWSFAKTEHSVLNLALRISTKTGKSVAFSGDGTISKHSFALYEGVNTLFHELFCYRKHVKGHTNLTELQKFILNSTIKHVVLSHFERNEKNKIKRALKNLTIGNTRIKIASPFSTILI